MSLSIEKITKDFTILTSQEKIEFLRTVIVAPPGEWIELNGKLHFIPEGPPATEEEEKALDYAKAEIEAGRGVPLDELKKRRIGI